MPESKHRKDRPKSRSHPPANEPLLPVTSQSSEMSGNDGVLEISELSFRQQSVLPIVAVARSIAQAARDSGVAESTLRRWLAEPSFREELDLLRKESADLARKQAQAALPACLSVVSEIAMESEEPSLRLRAAQFLITYATRISEIESLRQEVQDLNESVSLIRSTAPID